jgi:ribonuclease R
MLHLSNLGDDYWEFDPTGRSLTNTRTRRQLRLGDHIRVVVAAVDVDRRQLDLAPAGSGRPRTGRRTDSSFNAPSGRPGPLPPGNPEQHRKKNTGKPNSKKSGTGKSSTKNTGPGNSSHNAPPARNSQTNARPNPRRNRGK